MKVNKQLLLEDDVNFKYAYVTHDDLVKSNENFPKTQSILIRSSDPASLSIDVPDALYVYNNSTVKQKYQINVRSTVPADVYLVNKKYNTGNDMVANPQTKLDTNERLVLLQPPPSCRDYIFSMEKNDGIIDLVHDSVKC